MAHQTTSSAQRHAFLHNVCSRYGMEPHHFSSFEIIESNPKLLSLVSQDHRPCAEPKVLSSGLPFLRINLKFPKLTTGAAFKFGHLATKEVITLHAKHADSFMQRMHLEWAHAPNPTCTGSGYVICMHQGISLGLGLLIARPGCWRMESLLPKQLANASGRSIFQVRTNLHKKKA